MRKYEVFNCSEKDMEPLLNQMAMLGFRLVTAFPHPHGGGTFIMEKEV